MDRFSKLFSRAVGFAQKDIWRIRLTELSPGKSFLINLLRVLILSIRGFDEDKCQLRASALTFYSLISIVPVAAMAFGIAKGFGFAKMLEAQLRDKLAGHEEVFNKIVQFSDSLLENTKGGLIAGVGLIVLFWAVIKVLGQIEDAFNDIWGIKEKRPLSRKLGDYLSIMLICPVLIILASSVTVFVTTQVTLILEKITILGSFSSLIFSLLELLPFLLLSGLFTFIYLFMPNTKVRLPAGLTGGIVAGVLFQVVQRAYITLQVGTASYNAIYGSFAALPLFLGWLQISWLIVLYGAELSFAHQNVDTYEFEPDARQASHRLKTLLSLQIAHHLVQTFARIEPPPTARQISRDLELPIRLVNEILFELVSSGILSVTETERDKERAFQPARDIHDLTIQQVIEAMELRGINTMPFAHTPAFIALSKAMTSFKQAIEKLPANKPLQEL
ncbi:MAG: YihY/virulence factor BrkB family protein [Syntrophales bacterium]